MKSIQNFISSLKKKNMWYIFFLYIIIGILKYAIIIYIYEKLIREEFSSINLNCNDNDPNCPFCDNDSDCPYNDNDSDCIFCDNNLDCPYNDNDSDCTFCDNDSDCPYNLGKINKYHLIMVLNTMFYMYIIFGIFLYLLCKNNMKKAVWFIILYPFLSKLVWMLII